MLSFWKSEPQYAYKRYAYKKNMYTKSDSIDSIDLTEGSHGFAFRYVIKLKSLTGLLIWTW